VNEPDERHEISSGESDSEREERAHRKKNHAKAIRSKKQHTINRAQERSLSVPASQDMENLIGRIAGKRKPTDSGKKRRDEDRAMQPAKHITDDSALGQAFKWVNQDTNPDTSDS